MPPSDPQLCHWCGIEFALCSKGWALCDPCRERYRSRCLGVASAIWQSVPWRHRPSLALTGQYLDTRFLFEVRDVRLQRIIVDWRSSLLGGDVPIDRDSMSASQAKQLLKLYAPNRRLHGWSGVSEDELERLERQEVLEELDARGAPVIKEVKRLLASLVGGREWSVAAAESRWTRVDEAIVRAIREWIPSGPVFLQCLRVARRAKVAPHRVFRHLAFGESIVDDPWLILFRHDRVRERLKMRRPPNFGPYLGRFPPTRWGEIGRRQSLENLIRVWTCYSLEMLGLTARGAMFMWDGQRFHDHPFRVAEDDLDRTTSAAESNYSRDKKWLEARLKFVDDPEADLWDMEPSEFERYLQTLALSEGGLEDQLSRMNPSDFLPDI